MLSKTYQPLRKPNFNHHLTYYSKTQANFFKAYAQQSEFINKLNDLLNAVDKRKIVKLTDQVKIQNLSFKKYLHQKKIFHIKIQDVIKFQEMLQKTSNDPVEITKKVPNSQTQDFKSIFLPTLNHSKKSRELRLSMIAMLKNFSSLKKPKPQVYSPLQKQMIKKGFMSLLQKLQTLKKDEFINQTGYLQGVLVRESQKLKDYWVQNFEQNKQFKKGRKINIKKMNLCEQIDHEQKMNGLYPLIMKNIRQQTNVIQNAQNTFSLLMQN